MSREKDRDLMKLEPVIELTDELEDDQQMDDEHRRQRWRLATAVHGG